MKEAILFQEYLCPNCEKNRSESGNPPFCLHCLMGMNNGENFYDVLQQKKAAGKRFWDFRASLYEAMLPITIALGSGSFSYLQAVTLVAQVTQKESLPGYPILDVATGTGLVIKKLFTLGGEHGYVGLDYSREMLNQARKKLQNVPRLLLIRGDAHHLPFTDSSFGGITCAAALGNMRDPDQVVHEMARVTASGGSLTLLLTLMDEGMGWNVRLWKGLMDGLYQVGRVPLRWFSPQELIATLEKAGYRGVNLQELGGTWQLISARRE